MMGEAIKNRYDFVVLFDVTNGNPNGDPDAGNMPRVDPETGLGLVTDVCLKRKIRNYVEDAKEDAEGYRIYVKDSVPLETNDKEALKYCDAEKVAEAKKKDPDLDKKVRDFMCSNYYDIRTFGAVMTTFVKASLNCGQVRGPVQFGFARSIEPIVPQEVTITRCAITTEKDAAKKKYGNRAQIHCSLRAVSSRRLCIRQPGPQSNGVFRGGSGFVMAGHHQYVRKRSFRSKRQYGCAGVDCLRA